MKTRRSAYTNGTMPVIAEDEPRANRRSRDAPSSSEEPEAVITCPWLENSSEKFPVLMLPESSSDLLFESELLFPAAEIYETCMTYYRIIQISPFLFEDFCCALRSPDSTRLLAEIHIAFIRLFFRDDEDNQTSFCAQDTGNFFNVMLQLLDGMTYAEVLRYYLQSDPRFECNHIIEILDSNYPFVEAEKRITVLKWLCDFFLQTYSYRQLITSEGTLIYDDVCRYCGKLGDVLLCDGCEACYHIECVNLEEVPEGQWFCPICQAHCSRDTVDTKFLSDSMAKHKCRIAPLGFDRHGRLYWFFVKRIFVQEGNNSSVYYYSTLPQLYDLVKQLDPVHYEKDLCIKLSEALDEIARQMAITLELTRKHREALIRKIGGTRDTPDCYLDVENSFRMAKILKENFSENVKMETDGAAGSILARICEHLNITNGRLKNRFWSGGIGEQQLAKLQNSMIENVKTENGESTLFEMKMDNMRRGYRLGFSDGRYREYQSEYSTNELAKSFKQRGKERDKKKYLSARFALTEEGEFTWPTSKGRDIYSSETNVCKIIHMTVRKIVEKLPDELFHRLWPEEKPKFMERLSESTTASQMRYFVLQLERAIRKPVFTTIWWSSLGLTKLIRVTSDDREERSKIDAIRKKEEKALQSADPHLDSDIIFVKYLKARPSSLSLWRLRDEAFRLNNRSQMGGWLWVSSTLVRRFQKPEPVPLNIDYLNPSNNKKSPSINKALRLDKLSKKLAIWRDRAERLPGGALDSHLICYSRHCAVNPLGFSSTLRCYNPNCPRSVCELDPSKPSKAYKGGINPELKPPPVKPSGRKAVRGEGMPFPFPTPFRFMAKKSKKQSLLIIPQEALRRIARQGGMKASQYLPGFNKQAKSNSSVWPYPCPRPLFDNCWRFSTLNVKTLHALALSIRVMFSCIRWADMHPSSETEERVITHLADHDERRHIVSHKEHPPDGYYEQYKLRISVLSIDDDDEDKSETYRVGGGSMPRNRKRKAKSIMTSSANRRVTRTEERWEDGVGLKLYEIVSYWSRYNRTMSGNNTTPVTTRQQYQPTTVPQLRFATNNAVNTPPQNVIIRQNNATPLNRMPHVIYFRQPDTNRFKSNC